MSDFRDELKRRNRMNCRAALLALWAS